MNQTHTLVLSSRENFVWHSYQEIIPHLEKSWQQSSSLEHKVHVVNVDEVRLSELAPLAASVNNIVLLCFTPKIFQIAKVFREIFSSPARFVVHLHNQATLACWPMRQWGSLHLFQEHDVFISTCQADAQALHLVLPQAQVKVIPFSILKGPSFIQTQNSNSNSKKRFVFIGRITPQKNLHTLFLSLHHLRSRYPEVQWHLDIFGKEDHFGSPNMGIENNNYQSDLMSLAKALEIEKAIEFHGHQSREVIDQYLESHRSIFISPSLHSDENFGMAAFRSLIFGQKALLSSWGGHLDFKREFSSQVSLVNVHSGTSGPWISPQALSEKMFELAQAPTTEGVLCPLVYREKFIQKKYLEIALSPSASQEILKFSKLADEVFKHRQDWILKDPRQSKIFSNYSDPLALNFFSAYGAQPLRQEDLQIEEEMDLLPWARIDGENILVQDPHRGVKTFPVSAPSQKSTVSSKITIFDHQQNELKIPQSLAKELMMGGYLFSRPKDSSRG